MPPRQRFTNKKTLTPPIPPILRNLDTTTKVLEAILDTPNGRRTISRLARTCRALCEPALDILWRDLDSLVPLLWQFPGHLLKKARKPGLGFVKTPTEEDWKSVLKYGQRVRHVTYNETSNAVSPSVFGVLEETLPHEYILPHLTELTWKAETPAGLSYSSLFLNPKLRAVNLDLGSRFPQLDTFLANLSRQTQLSSFSFVSPTSLPDSFTELVNHQVLLEKLVLVAPGALAPGVGRWVACLPNLNALRLDLTGRSMIAVEGFFDELRLRSGDSTPTSVGSTDSGVFSDDETDFSLIRKSALHLTGDLRLKGSFSRLRKLHLTGEVANIAVFIKHLDTPLTFLELVIDDPPERADWHDLCTVVCDKLQDSLQYLRITATSSSRFVDLIRSTPRAEPSASRLSLEHITHLPHLTRLDIDLPESVIFTDADLQCLTKACPNIEVLKLCPLARFPNAAGAPKITLESIAYLATECKNLNTISVVVDAKASRTDILTSRHMSSRSLLRLHVGHSWIDDPLQVAILLSHMAPYLETLKWFQDKTRPGYVEANATSWQKVSELLPHLQNMRIIERKLASDTSKIIVQEKVDRSVDATIKTFSRGLQASVLMRTSSIQASSTYTNQGTQAQPDYSSTAINVVPSTAEASVGSSVRLLNKAVEVTPPPDPTKDLRISKGITNYVRALTLPSTFSKTLYSRPFSPLLIFPPLISLFSLAFRLLIFYPLSLPSRLLQVAVARRYRKKEEATEPSENVSSYTLSPEPTTVSEVPLDTLVVEVRN